MINPQHGCPHVSGMAGFTQLGRRNMRGGFTGGKSTIVATVTGINHTGVTKDSARPACRGVTHIAGLDRRNMSRGFSRGDNAVMAGLAGSQHLGMIHHHHRRENIRGMAGLANIGSGDVRGTFTKGCRAVMAA